MKEVKLRSGHIVLIDENVYTMYKLLFDNQFVFVGKDGYPQLRISLHRLVLDCPRGYVIDHKNGDKLDNTRDNLRIATHAQNIYNQKPKTIASSAYKGVYWNKEHKKWRADIQKAGKQICLGYFDNEVAAAKSYDVKARELFGPYAWLNFPDSEEMQS